jgi:hypothetical protein
VIILDDIFRVLTGRMSDEELVMVKESEEASGAGVAAGRAQA